MSADDCERFSDQLLELAYGELDDAEADRLRRHAADCEACRSSLEEILLTRKLAAQLPRPDYDPSGDERILELAARTADRQRESSEEIRSSSDSIGELAHAPERRAGLLERIAGVLLRPALVTAGVAAVVFAVTFAVFRQSSAPPDLEQVESSGAPFRGPAVPVARSTAERPDGEAEERREAGRPVRTAESEPAPAAPLGTGRGGGGRAKGGMERPGSGIGTSGPASQTVDETAAADSRRRESEQALESKKSAAAALDDALEESDDLSGSAASGPARAERQAAPGAGSLGMVGDGAASFFSRGISAYDRGDCETATRLLERVLSTPGAAPHRVAAALHHIAGCQRRSGRCGEAVGRYEKLLDEHPGYSKRPRVLWEAASCYRRLGRIDRARETLELLAEYPQWNARARGEMENLPPEE
ncbi:MAG: tetratricopeptide repeat protein [Polyangia bacterium]